jgi:hypothetical protein
MADFYPKKKRKVGPSKNDEKLQRQQDAADNARAAGTLAQNFPGVTGLKVALSIKGAQGQLLEEKTFNLNANSPFQVKADCPGACGSGKFDFADYVADALNNGRLVGKAELSCGMPSYSGPSGSTCTCLATASFEARK